MKKTIQRREASLLESGSHLSPLLQRIYTGRGVRSVAELEYGLDKLLSFQLLSQIDLAVDYLVTALQLKQKILVIGDFDADGATSTTLAVTCLGLMKAEVAYLVPNRFEFGYGLSPEIVEVAAKMQPQLLLTVDNGISSIEGVAKAQSLNIKVIITDHHLPGDTLPMAQAIVNPNLCGDQFPSKNLAGVGVIFYVMMALRAKLRDINWFNEQQIEEPNMASFLDLVALGTVADVVPLDQNNRILVHQGLLRIRAGRCRPGIKALLAVAGKTENRLSAADLGFGVAPRLNAAGRLVDMSLGIECLLAKDNDEAQRFAQSLDALNKERQQIEQDMQADALTLITHLDDKEHLPLGLCLYDSAWHQGIIGILASRVKERLHRPVFIFASAGDSLLKASGRSISGVHLKDALEQISKENPGLIDKFGGHAMAAGLSMNQKNYELFATLFDAKIGQLASAELLQGIIYSDGNLTAQWLNLETASLLRQAGPWGQHFPEPIFDGQFRVVNRRILKNKHIKFVLESLEDFFMVDAIAFNLDEEKLAIKEDDKVHAAYRLDINDYRGNKNLQLLIDYFDKID